MMTIETCYNYLVFLNNACDRYLKNQDIDEEEVIHQLKIEFDRFIKKANQSDLPSELKNKLNDLKLEYTYNPRREYSALLGRFNFGSNRRRIKLLNQIDDFKFQIKGLPMFIQLNY